MTACYLKARIFAAQAMSELHGDASPASLSLDAVGMHLSTMTAARS
jgi:hypothetical protein